MSERRRYTGNVVIVTKLVKDCQYGVSPVNYSDSDSEAIVDVDEQRLQVKRLLQRLMRRFYQRHQNGKELLSVTVL